MAKRTSIYDRTKEEIEIEEELEIIIEDKKKGKAAVDKVATLLFCSFLDKTQRCREKKNTLFCTLETRLDCISLAPKTAPKTAPKK